MEHVTLNHLMAEDLDVWISKNPKFGFDMRIDDENGKTIVDENGIHAFAAESFAFFCRRYLAAYEKASQTKAA